MDNKERMHIYIEPELKKLLEDQTDNCSQLITQLLERYLSVSSTEHVIKEIQKHKDAIIALEQKLENMSKEGILATKEEAMATVSMDELKRLYTARRKALTEEYDEFWINSPNNLRRCKLLGMDPSLVLQELRAWYNNNGVKNYP